MTIKPHQRALCPTDQGTSGINTPTTPGVRPNHPVQSTPRDADNQAPRRISMDYQQGFFSGPSS